MLSPAMLAESPPPPDDTANFRVDAALVMVPVTVTDRRGATINGLRREAFSLFENRALRPILTFSEQDEPASMGVVLDLSGSMKDTVGRARATLTAFLTGSEPDDEALLAGVSDHPVVLHGFSRDSGSMIESALTAKVGGSTALIDTLYLVLAHMKRAHNSRRALLVLSDGIDNHSHHERRELMSAAMEADVQIYTVSLDNAPRYRKPIELQEYARGLELLSDLSAKTGGLHYVVRNQADIADTVARIQRALKNQYVLGYKPATPDLDGKWRAIHVKLGLPDARVSARRGYYSR